MAISPISFLNPQVQEREARRVNFFQTGQVPQIGAVETGSTGAHIPTSIGRVDDGNGNMISLGSSQGVGLAYVDPKEKNFWVG